MLDKYDQAQEVLDNSDKLSYYSYFELYKVLDIWI